MDMHRAWQEEDYTTVAELAHDIKGTGGTIGFDEFTAPAASIEESARQRQSQGIQAGIAELARLGEELATAVTEPASPVGPGRRTEPEAPCVNELPHHNVAEGRKPSGFAAPDGSRHSAKSATYLRKSPDSLTDAATDAEVPSGGRDLLRARRRSPAPTAATDQQDSTIAPVTSSLPLNDPEFRQIVLGFLPRLQEQLEEMDVAWQRGDLDGLAKLAHWLKGAGGTVGFSAFTEPALILEEKAKSNDTDEIEQLLKEIKGLADAIVIPEYECVS